MQVDIGWVAPIITSVFIVIGAVGFAFGFALVLNVLLDKRKAKRR
jgi:hypothetical protein